MARVDEQTFKSRTKWLALETITLVEALPHNRSADVIGKQLLRSAMSVGANYRAACRGKSTADMVAKLAIVEEEADEAMYWMELLVETGVVPASRVGALAKEANEIIEMTVCLDEDSAETGIA
jgi:four helix bundle protein